MIGGNPSRALITGVTGQDGSYLSEHLQALGYEVGGLVHENGPGAPPVPPGVKVIVGDLTDEPSLRRALRDFQPSEIYNLGGLSSVGASFEQPVATIDITGLGAVRLLEAVRSVDPSIRFFQASSAEIFGDASGPQTDSSPLRPSSPYGAAKALAHEMVRIYRHSYGMFSCNGILFNHESPRRGPLFVTRKITSGAARIKLGLADSLSLGNLDVYRDWGYAGDYVVAMHALLQQPQPHDVVIATGQSHSLRDFLEMSFSRLGMRWQDHVVVDESLIRPSEVVAVTGDPLRAQELLGWTATTTFEGLVAMMVDADVESLRGEDRSLPV